MFFACCDAFVSPVKTYHVLVVSKSMWVAWQRCWVLWRKAILQTEASASSMLVDVWAVRGWQTTCTVQWWIAVAMLENERNLQFFFSEDVINLIALTTCDITQSCVTLIQHDVCQHAASCGISQHSSFSHIRFSLPFITLSHWIQFELSYWHSSAVVVLQAGSPVFWELPSYTTNLDIMLPGMHFYQHAPQDSEYGLTKWKMRLWNQNVERSDCKGKRWTHTWNMCICYTYTVLIGFYD